MKEFEYIRKVKHDEMWHVVYDDGSYDRVTEKNAKATLQNSTIIDGSLAIDESDICMILPYVRWGTCGKDGKQPLEYVRLVDCDDEHLKAILKTQPWGNLYPKIIWLILANRALNEILKQ